MALSSRKQLRQQAKTSRLQSKKRKCDVSRIGLKAVELNRREADIFKREGALVEGEKELAKREAIVAALIEKVEERDASAGEVLGQLKGMLAACASLLEVTKSALADVVVLETEARIAHDELDAEVKAKIRKRPRQDLDEIEADSELQKLKPKNGSLLNSTASQFMLMLYFSLVRRGHSPNSAVQETHDMLGISRKRVMQVNYVELPSVFLCLMGRVRCRDCGVCPPFFSKCTAPFVLHCASSAVSHM